MSLLAASSYLQVQSIPWSPLVYELVETCWDMLPRWSHTAWPHLGIPEGWSRENRGWKLWASFAGFMMDSMWCYQCWSWVEMMFLYVSIWFYMFLDSPFTMFLDMFPSKSQLKVALKRRYRATGCSWRICGRGWRTASHPRDRACPRHGPCTSVVACFRVVAEADRHLERLHAMLQQTHLWWH